MMRKEVTMRVYPVIVIYGTFCTLFDCAFAIDCRVRFAENSDIEWDDYHISADNSYTFTAICRCSIGKPIWTYYTDTTNNEIIDSTNEPYCINSTEPCTLAYIPVQKPGLHIYLKLVNYTVTESTLLLCGNTNFNYARGISVVITNTTIGKDTDNSTLVSTTKVTIATTVYPFPSSTSLGSTSTTIPFLYTKVTYATGSPSSSTTPSCNDLGIIIGIAIAVSAITVFLVVAVVTGSVVVFICIRTTKQKHTQVMIEPNPVYETVTLSTTRFQDTMNPAYYLPEYTEIVP